MGLYDETAEVARRTMVLFFVIDTSGSMSGSKIGAVNTAIQEVIPEIKNISEGNSDAAIKIAALSFSTGAEWITSEPVTAENFSWDDIDAEGVTDFGRACLALDEKLSRNAFMNEARGSYAPVILLMSDGEPTDDYRSGLEQLKKNNWFRAAIKVAIAIGEDANREVLADFTGTSEAVITVHTPGELKKWIKFMSVKSSEIGSSSTNNTSKSRTEQMNDQINNEKTGWGDWDNADNSKDPWSSFDDGDVVW